MGKIFFCNLDLIDPKVKNSNDALIQDEILNILDELSNCNHKFIFNSRDNNRLNNVKDYCDSANYSQFVFLSRNNAKDLVRNNVSNQNSMIVIGNRDIDFQFAVNEQLLLIVPTWVPCEEKALMYGLHVDNIAQFRQLVSIVINNDKWFAELQVDDVTRCISLYDARTRIAGLKDSEINIISNFQNILKRGTSRNYYQILLYFFLANMTRDNTFNDIEIFGVVPSSNKTINPELYKFAEQVRYIKKVQIPRDLQAKTPEERNILIRHTTKPQQHKLPQVGREMLGGVQEFETLCLNSAYKDKINRLKNSGKLNICIFDDYMNYGNGFNAIRCLFKELGANKIVLVSLGLFRQSFYKNDYKLYGDIFMPGYKYKLQSMSIQRNFEINKESKKQIDYLYTIYNNQ